MNRVDKARVGAAFSRGAEAYDRHARVQRAAVERVLALVAEHAHPPRSVLDVGAGTGLLLDRLRAIHPRLCATGVDLAPGMARAVRDRTGATAIVGDAESLPFQDDAFDLVVSTSTLQWLPALDRAVAEAARVLAPGGLLVIALFGDQTLQELRASWRAAVPDKVPDRLHRVFTRAEVDAALRASRSHTTASGTKRELEVLLVDTERHVEHHASVLDLLRELRRIGAGNAAPDRARGLADAHFVARTIERYERLRVPEGIPATWDVVYAVARRP